ncbi:MAG: gliding motility-associated C-terminal domain-containing protein [Chitinophagaceae bacterium]
MKKILFFLLLLCSFLVSNKIQAAHIAAGDIYYEYISPLKYRVHLILYQDCGPTSSLLLGGTELVQVSSASCGYNINLIVDTTGYGPVDTLSSLCDNVQNWCKNPNSIFPAYEKWHYSDTITLPQACTDWEFTYTTCCRNNAVANIATASSQGICIKAGLNNVARPTNSSPVLTVDPIPYVCVNQINTYLNGPIDPDLDSLVFTNIVPKGTTCNNLTYAGTNTLINPLPVTPVGPTGYVVDPSTGTVIYTPTAQGVYVLAFQATDYDKVTGEIVGYSQRDVQLNVLACNAAPPQITSISNNPIQNLCPTSILLGTTPTVTIGVCPGSQVCFDVEATSTSVSNNVKTYANNASSCPGSTYTSNPVAGGNPVTGSFSWVPTGADIGDHTLIMTFADSTCNAGQPIVLKSYQVVLIKVYPGVDAGPDLTTCANADSVQMFATGPSNITQWTWTDIGGGPAVGLSDPNIHNPMAFPPTTTTYVLNTNAQTACKSKDTITVNILPGITVSAGPDITICANDQANILATVSVPQTNPTISWSPTADLNNPTILNPVASPLATENYTLTYVDDDGCIYSDVMKVDVNGARPVLNAMSSENNVCPGYPFQLFSNAASMPCGLSVFQCTGPVSNLTVATGNIPQNQASPYYSHTSADGVHFQMLFTAVELREVGIKPGNINSLAWNVTSKQSDTLRNFKISMGCTSQTDYSNNSYVGNTSVVLDTIKYYSSFGWNVHQLEKKYFWDGLSNLVVDVCFTYTGNTTLNDFVQSSNTLATSTLMSTQTATTIADPCNLAALPLAYSIRPNTRFNVCETGDFNYSWQPSGTLDNSLAQDPYSSGVYSTTDFTVTVVSSSNPNCTSTDVVQVAVDNSNAVTATASPAVLCEPGFVTLTGTPVGPLPVYECGEENVPCQSPYSPLTVGTGAVLGSPFLTPFTPVGAPGAKTQMIYTVAQLNALGITKGNIESLSFNISNKTSTAGHNMMIKMGCTPLNTFTNAFIPSSQLKTVYQNANYNTVLGPNLFMLNSPFLWDGVNNVVVEVCYFNGTGNSIGTGDEVVYTPSTVGTTPYYSQNSTVGGCEIPDVGGLSAPVASAALPDITFGICQVTDKPWPFKWEPGTFVYDSTAGVTTAYVNSTATFHVFTKGGNKCVVEDSVTITISVHDIKVTPVDTTICEGDSYKAFAYGSGNAPSSTLQWFDKFGGSAGLSCVNCTSPTITPPNPSYNVYYCVRTDSYGCLDTAVSYVNVLPKPTINILNGDSIIIKYQQEVNLIATGGYIYNWTPVWGTSNPNIPNMIVSPAEPTLYTVYGFNEDGCRNSDSIYVNIDYLDNLFVPNAFSPNGDGNNDIFKVANLTFQNIQEFKVLNRWGQEMYSSSDNKGWDGRFKGKPQDPGTYFYLIRVAYPDGSTKMFKGDVTLLR